MKGKKRHIWLWFLPEILAAGFSLFSYRRLHENKRGQCRMYSSVRRSKGGTAF